MERIIQGQPKRIPIGRKLSIRAVEEEANLGNGSGYYYPELVEKVKKAKAGITSETGVTPRSDTERLRAKAKQESRIKDKYKEKNTDLKEQLSRMATEQHHLNDAIRKALVKIDELEQENTKLKEKLVDLRRNSITPIS